MFQLSVAWYKFVSVSEVLTASIIRAMIVLTEHCQLIIRRQITIKQSDGGDNGIDADDNGKSVFLPATSFRPQ